jgi:hypothetical protein
MRTDFVLDADPERLNPRDFAVWVQAQGVVLAVGGGRLRFKVVNPWVDVERIEDMLGIRKLALVTLLDPVCFHCSGDRGDYRYACRTHAGVPVCKPCWFGPCRTGHQPTEGEKGGSLSDVGWEVGRKGRQERRRHDHSLPKSITP